MGSSGIHSWEMFTTEEINPQDVFEIYTFEIVTSPRRQWLKKKKF